MDQRFIHVVWLLTVVSLGAPTALAQQAPSAAIATPSEEVAGYIFNTPVPLANYRFAKLAVELLPRPGFDRKSTAEQERAIWEMLILHFEATRQGITISEEQLEERVNGYLRTDDQPFTRVDDPEAYEQWVRERLGAPIELFENQLEYFLMIEELKKQTRASRVVTVTDDNIYQAFLNNKRHVGGEMVIFETLEEAQAFYEQYRNPKAWKKMKKKGKYEVRPVMRMTLIAYIDLWGIPQERIDTLYSLELETVDEPMAFGTKWCVYRVLEKVEADPEKFGEDQNPYYQQVKHMKQAKALTEWIEALKASAKLRVLPVVSRLSEEPTASQPDDLEDNNRDRPRPATRRTVSTP